MSDDVIELLTEIQIKAHFTGNKDKYILSIEDLIRFCIKMMKVIRNFEEEK